MCVCKCGGNIYVHSRYRHVGFMCSVDVYGVSLCVECLRGGRRKCECGYV